MHMPGVKWELVQTGEVKHVGPQVSELPGPMNLALQGDAIIHARRPYEVHIIFPEGTGTGLGIDLRSGYTYGLEMGVNYRNRSLLMPDDRFYAASSGGIAVRERLDTDRLYVHFSRALLTFQYDTLAFFGKLRANVWLYGDALARQRRDLGLENYNAFDVDAALQASVELRKGLQFQIGAGFEWRRLYGFTGTAGMPISPDVMLADRKRPLIRIIHESVFDPTVLRWERRHTLMSEFRLYFPFGDQPGFAWLDLNYQHVTPFGWHDFWIKSRAYGAFGDVTFHDEVSVGEFLRGVFGNQFVKLAANLQLEFRFSIVRDIFKISLFHDLAVFAVQPVRGQPTLLAQLGNAFGPGFHFLAQDMFQVDTYLVFGFRRQGVFNFAFSMQIQKTF